MPNLINFGGIVFVMSILFLITIGIIVLISYYFEQKKKKDYYNSSYYLFTQNDYSVMRKDLGLLGEYETFKQLKVYENYGGKFLYNIYLPKEDGKTTEIDMMFLSPKGLFVFESKNFSGYIIGDMDHNEWIQSLNKHTKNKFYNPVRQNANHIEYLKKNLTKQLPIYSIVVFSERCSLKKVPAPTSDTYVIKRHQVKDVVKWILNHTNEVMSYREVRELQESLFPYSQRNKEEKIKHINDIRNYKENVVNANQKDEELRHKLKAFRTEMARKYRKPLYYIFNDDELEQLITIKPKKQSDVYNILPKVKANYYSKEIVRIINEIIS